MWYINDYGKLYFDSQAHADEAAARLASAFLSARVFLSTFDALGPRFAADIADMRASADYDMRDEWEGHRVRDPESEHTFLRSGRYPLRAYPAMMPACRRGPPRRRTVVCSAAFTK